MSTVFFKHLKAFSAYLKKFGAKGRRCAIICCMKAILKIEAPDFSLSQTLLCGQYFRATPIDEGSFAVTLCGHTAVISQSGESVTIESSSEEACHELANTLGINDDYSAIRALFSADPILKNAMALAGGLRIMRQPLFETVVSFIISQNNNIPRICGIISRLCENFGQPIEGGFDFPTPSRLAPLCESDLAPLRCGFRDKYILDAARRFENGEIGLDTVHHAPLPEAQSELMKIKGVGPKVADCALLFGAHRLDAFPADVWIKRAMRHYFPAGLPEAFAPYAGIAQQYIFVYARENLPPGAE